MLSVRFPYAPVTPGAPITAAGRILISKCLDPMKTTLAATIAIILALAFTAADQLSQESEACPEGMDPYVEYRLFFGRSTADGMVADADWDAFLASEVTSRFPEGLTVLDAYGQWRSSSGELLREHSKVVLIVAPPGGAAKEHARSIADAYKSRFDQESVLLVVTDACATF